MITIQDLLNNNTEMYDIIIKQWDDNTGCTEIVYDGSAYSVPEAYRYEDIKYIYATRYDDCVRVVFEI